MKRERFFADEFDDEASRWRALHFASKSTNTGIEIVNEMIGIRHIALIYAIARYLGVPPSTGSQFTGRGFAMRANIEAIRKVLDERTR